MTTRIDHISGPATINVNTDELTHVAKQLSVTRVICDKSVEDAAYHLLTLTTSLLTCYPQASTELMRLFSTVQNQLIPAINHLAGRMTSLSYALHQAAQVYSTTENALAFNPLTTSTPGNTFGFWPTKGDVTRLWQRFMAFTEPLLLSGTTNTVSIIDYLRTHPDALAQTPNPLLGNITLFGFKTWSLFLGYTPFTTPQICRKLNTPNPHVTTPKTSHDLLKQLSATTPSPTYSRVRVLTHTTPSPTGKPTTSYTILIRGTQQWGLHTNHPNDMGSNIQAMARQQSDAQRAVEQAIKAAKIPPGATVELVGHSQGGIVAAKLSSDAAFTQKYNVVSTLTVGAPVAHFTPADSTHMLSFEHTWGKTPAHGIADPIAALDFSPNTASANHTTVYGTSTALNPHDISEYVQTAAAAENTPDLNMDMWRNHRTTMLGINENTTTTATDFAISQPAHPNQPK